MTEEKQVRIRVEKKEYHMISEGDLYYLFMLSRPNGEDTMLKYWRRDAICLDDEMSGFLGDLSVLQRRYDFAWKK